MDVLIVDDDPLLRDILAASVQSAVDDATTVAVGDLEEAFRRLAHFKAPDLALLDLGLPGNSGLDALKRFRWKFPQVRVVVVSAVDDAKSIGIALNAGAVGYIPKTSPPQVMVAALRQVAAGGRYVPPEANR
jgi:DNA-binding NarL/FixJ family response regulator